jgi:hypothetical protein
MPNSRDSQGNTEKLPTREEIEKRAYDLYLKGGEELSALEYWLSAEEQLKNERATVDPTPPQGKTAAAVAGRVVKR